MSIFRRSWEVVPGQGEELLQQVGQANILWHQLNRRGYGRGSTAVADRNEHLQASTNSIVKAIIDAALKEGGDPTDFDAHIGQLTESEGRDLQRAPFARYTMQLLAELSEDPYLITEQRIRLTVDKPGVSIKMTGDPITELTTDSLSGSAQLKPGFSYMRKMIRRLQPTPPMGGVLVLSDRGTNTYIHGLVVPATGEPLVSLEVLRKA